jgi:hypothetical protein
VIERTPVNLHDSVPHLRRQSRDRLEKHMEGLRAHLEAIGLRAEAAAVATELQMLRTAR